jgi:hypothetical protein
MGVITRRTGPSIAARACLAAGVIVLAATSAAGAAPTGATGAGAVKAPKPVDLRLKTHQEFTPTGVTLKPGDTVAITTRGTMVFGGGLNDPKSPVGVAWGKDCDAIFRSQPARKRPWPAPGLRCWSMIAKVGSGPAFEIGTGKTFRATDAGLLSLGINDNFVRDNKGFWFATIKVNAPGAVATPTTPATAAPPATDKKSSNTMMFVLIGALLLLVILLVIFVLARRRGDSDEHAPEPVEPVLVGAASAAGTAPLEPITTPDDFMAMSAGPVGAAPLPESIDVNIFEVEFSNGLTLRVGYNHFPEGVDLRWKVTQNRIPVATGRFVTKGGGSTNHFETLTLGIKLEGRDAQPDGADVQFDWTLNDVPFRYSVRRDPNC